MSASLSSLTLQALALSERERADLAGLLLESLPESSDEAPEVIAEMNRRAEELKSGTVAGLSTREAFGFDL